DDWFDVCSPRVIAKLRELNSILIPHGSLVEYVGLERIRKIPIPIFGLRDLLVVESNQHSKMELLSRAGIRIPKSYRFGDNIDGVVIVKLPGAKGGKGYFIARRGDEVIAGINKLLEEGIIKDVNEVLIQEYVIGVPAYFHYFNSVILKRLELFGIDIRYESNVDGLRRLPMDVLSSISPTFNVVGNLPLVVRESLLPTVMRYGMNFIEATRNYLPPGIVGPFCLEGIIRDDGGIVIFEFSGRIVAGTNLYVQGSPYSQFYWDEPMSMGRRIAREIKLAIQEGRLNEILT
ncbi:MAG: formate--phosphoribosylaminoimidazolecarboxamide ligase, partial [Sulfolobales archaeon]